MIRIDFNLIIEEVSNSVLNAFPEFYDMKNDVVKHLKGLDSIKSYYSRINMEIKYNILDVSKELENLKLWSKDAIAGIKDMEGILEKGATFGMPKIFFIKEIAEYKYYLEIENLYRQHFNGGLVKGNTQNIDEKLSQRQIALLHIYIGPQITAENAKEIAAKHGYTAENSKTTLLNKWNGIRNTCDRINRTGKSATDMLNDMKKIDQYVIDKKQREKFLDELNSLKTNRLDE